MEADLILDDIWKWVDKNSGILSIILSLIGFIILVIQTRKAQNATEAARSATEKVIRTMSYIDTISDLARIRSEMNNIQAALRGERYETTLLRVQTSREELFQLRNRIGFESDSKRNQVQLMVTFLKRLQNDLEKKLDDSEFPLSVSDMNIGLSDHSATVSQWAEEMKLLQGGLQK